MTGAAPVICIDGPSGAGKGTLSQRLATDLGWHLLDSGRCIAWSVLPVGSRPSHWRTATPSPGLPDPSMLTFDQPREVFRCGWLVRM